jgi:hypothetical protein
MGVDRSPFERVRQASGDTDDSESPQSVRLFFTLDAILGRLLKVALYFAAFIAGDVVAVFLPMLALADRFLPLTLVAIIACGAIFVAFAMMVLLFSLMRGVFFGVWALGYADFNDPHISIVYRRFAEGPLIQQLVTIFTTVGTLGATLEGWVFLYRLLSRLL